MSSFDGVTKFKPNRPGVKIEILLNEEISAECLKYAERIAQNANMLSGASDAEYIAEIRTKGRTRGGAIVRPDSDEATQDNLNHNTLEKALRL